MLPPAALRGASRRARGRLPLDPQLRGMADLVRKNAISKGSPTNFAEKQFESIPLHTISVPAAQIGGPGGAAPWRPPRRRPRRAAGGTP